MTNTVVTSIQLLMHTSVQDDVVVVLGLEIASVVGGGLIVVLVDFMVSSLC